MLSCLSGTDQTAPPSTPRVDHEQHDAFGHPEGAKAPLAIVPTVVRPFESRALEDQLCQFEIDAVLGQIGGPLAFVPFEWCRVYLPSVHTKFKRPQKAGRRAALDIRGSPADAARLEDEAMQRGVTGFA
jgi:hypothetical protein